MASKKKYRIYCNTCAGNKEGWSNLDDPPSQCPINAAHSVNSGSKAITEILALDNLSAITDPGVGDDINDGYIVGSRWVNTLTQDGFVNIDNSAGAAVWNKSHKDVFGTEVQYVQDLISTSTTSTDYSARKLRLTTPSSLPAGTYRIGFSCQAHVNSKMNNSKVRGQVDDTDTLFERVQTQTDSADYLLVAWFCYRVLASGAHNIDLDYASSNSGLALYIQDAHIELWRVS